MTDVDPRIVEAVRESLKECVWWCNDWGDELTLDGDINVRDLAETLIEKLAPVLNPVLHNATSPTKEGENP